MPSDGDRQLAAALFVVADAGLLTGAELVGRIDCEIAESPDPPLWLIEASLARTPSDRLHFLAAASRDHPLRHDSLAFLEALAAAHESGRVGLEAIVQRITRLWQAEDLPADVERMVHDVDVEVACADDRLPPAEAEWVLKAVRCLFRHCRGRSKWHDAINRGMAGVGRGASVAKDAG
jgi:hypothetical protein